MATWTIKTVRRPRVLVPATGLRTDASHLRVEMQSDELQTAITNLYFADHAGLQAEWEAGTVITVLDATIDTWIAAHTDTDDDQLPSGTRTGKEGYGYTE